MLREERETVIVANLADLDESRLQVDGDRPWLCRVPAEFWNGRALRVGRRRRVDGESLQNRLQARGTPSGSKILAAKAVAHTPDMGREESCAETLL